MILSEMQIKYLKKLVASGNTDEAVKELFEIIDTRMPELKNHSNIKFLYNELVIISGKLNNIKNQSQFGLIYKDQEFVETNRINANIIEFIDRLQSVDIDGLEIISKSNQSGFEFDAFLCFSSNDIQEAKDLWEKLTKNGLRVFMSEEALRMEAGSSFIDRIEYALENSQHFILLCTDFSLQSQWVKVEYETFLNEFFLKDDKKRKLILIKGKNDLTRNIPLLLRRLQYAESVDSIIKSINSAIFDKGIQPLPYPTHEELSADTRPVDNTSDIKEKGVKGNKNIPDFKENQEANKKTKPAFQLSNPINLVDSTANFVNSPNSYLPSEALTTALNTAVALGQPLLLTGEPGVGKTTFANYVAYKLELGAPLIFNTKSTSALKDILYSHEEKGHLFYLQTRKEMPPISEIEEKFIRYRALGEAIKNNKRVVVLIDEIDKAPRDFPNDLLDLMETLKFDVPEIDMAYSSSKENKPIIIITSNSEKNLPEPFLRRCIYFHIPFPDHEQLLNILHLKFPSEERDRLLISCVELFENFRTISVRKKPSIGELITWVNFLRLVNVQDTKSERFKIKLRESLPVIFKTQEDLYIAQSNLDIFP